MARRPPAAQTAFGPMVIAAVEQFEPADLRIVTDALAVRFLPPALATMVRTCRWPWWRKQLVRLTESSARGLWAGMLCRKRYADDQVLAALDTTDQLVVLGAGFDTRAYRVADPDRVRVYEVDLPANIDAKRTRVRAVLGAVPGHVRLVPVDFESGDLAESLTAAGLDFERPVMVVWEAVTQYLTEDAVRRTFALLARAAPGSRLIFTFVRQDFLDGTNAYGAEGAYRRFVARQRIWRYGMYPDRVAAFLAEYGWTEDEQVGAAEYRERYLEPAGRDLPVSEIERFVSATRS